MIEQLKGIRENKDFFDRTVDIAEVKPVVEEIIAGVKSRGDAALQEYTEKFDGVRLKGIEVGKEEIEDAKGSVDEDTLRCIEEASAAIRDFHYRQKRRAGVEEFRFFRYFMWVDVVKWLPNNPKSEEKGGGI